MAFGRPTKIWKLDLNRVKNGTRGWDYAVTEASLDYGGRIVSNVDYYVYLRALISSIEIIFSFFSVAQFALR